MSRVNEIMKKRAALRNSICLAVATVLLQVVSMSSEMPRCALLLFGSQSMTTCSTRVMNMLSMFKRRGA